MAAVTLNLGPGTVRAEGGVGEGAEEARFLDNVRQLTFAGNRAGEGYFSADGRRMIFQSERDPENPFFQIFLLDLESGDTTRVSPGTGKTTCAWIHPSGDRVLFASTHEDPEAGKKQAEEIAFRESGKERRYSWDYDEHFDLFVAGLDGSAPVNVTNTRGYDAEGSFSPDGEWIVFASNRHAYSEDLPEADRAKFEVDKAWAMELYRMRADGTGLTRLTDTPGYDGGPFFSADGSRICWRRFSEDGATAEIWTANTDGSDARQLTRLGAMSWAPYFHPSGEYLVFATNLQGFANFELYLVDAAGVREPVRVTTTDGFDGLPAFSPDGRTLAWTSNRTPDRKSQIFTADWNHEAAREALGVGGAAAPELAAGGDGDDAVPPPQPETAAAIAGDDLRRHVEILASDAFEGRLTGTRGERLATAYVAAAFRKLGLEPAGEDGSFFDPFEFTAGVSLGEGNVLAVNKRSFEVGTDWQPLSFSTTGDLGGAGVVFAGYGIEIPEGEAGGAEGDGFYSSYVHLDVEGKWVMVFRYMPEGLAAEQRQRFARYSSLRYKAMVARQKGAKGILVVSGPNAQVKNQLVPLTFDASLAGSGIGALAITDAVATAILEAGGGGRDLDLKALQDAHDTGEMQNGIPLEGAEVSATVEIEQEKRIGRNVIARLAAPEGAGDGRAVLIGAHVDHLGARAGANSRATEEEAGQVHHGADDNASGVAGLLEIAEWLAARAGAGELELERDVLFAAWSGEEIGLLGSAHFANAAAGTGDAANGNPHASLQDRFVAYLNMDMIGRLEKALVLQGVGSSPFWPSEIEKRNVPIGLPIVTQNESYLPTDATSFYLKGVPILSAFTGAHEDYHRPTDTADKIDYENAGKTARLIGLVARGLATSDAVPEYQPMEKPEEKGARAGLRAYLGTIPDYAQGDIAGVKLSGVAKGGPADKAGVRAGDIIVSLAGREVKNIYDYTYVIEAVKIGQEVAIEVERDGERVALRITPESRD